MEAEDSRSRCSCFWLGHPRLRVLRRLFLYSSAEELETAKSTSQQIVVVSHVVKLVRCNNIGCYACTWTGSPDAGAARSSSIGAIACPALDDSFVICLDAGASLAVFSDTAIDMFAPVAVTFSGQTPSHQVDGRAICSDALSQLKG